MVRRWELIAEQPGSSGRLPVVARQYRLPDGNRADWDIFGPEQTVAILAITPAGEVVLARQYRPGPDAILDELPGGLVEPGEEVAAAAARELLEETGYAGEVSVVADTWLSGASRTRRFCAVARSAESVSAPLNEPGEFCDVILMSLSRFREHLRSGNLTDTDLGYLGLDHLGLLH